MRTFRSLLALATLVPLATNAQIFEEGGKYLHLGIGVGSAYAYSGSTMGVPPIHASLEVGVTDKIGVGGLIGYTSSKWEQTYIGDKYSWNFSYLIIGARGAYHFYNEDKWDAYGGLMLGYNVASAKFESTDPDLEQYVTEPSVGGFALGAFVGARYGLGDSGAIFAELGYSIAWLSLGYCVRF